MPRQGPFGLNEDVLWPLQGLDLQSKERHHISLAWCPSPDPSIR